MDDHPQTHFKTHILVEQDDDDEKSEENNKTVNRNSGVRRSKRRSIKLSSNNLQST